MTHHFLGVHPFSYRDRLREAIGRMLPPQWSSGEFYKGRSQEKNLSRGRKFSCFAAHVNERDLF
jgi:hypothetical protein